jgi:hypothetical protein
MQSYISQEAVKSPQPEVHIAVGKFSKYEIVAQTLADLQHRAARFVRRDCHESGADYSLRCALQARLALRAQSSRPHEQ